MLTLGKARQTGTREEVTFADAGQCRLELLEDMCPEGRRAGRWALGPPEWQRWGVRTGDPRSGWDARRPTGYAGWGG